MRFSEVTTLLILTLLLGCAPKAPIYVNQFVTTPQAKRLHVSVGAPLYHFYKYKAKEEAYIDHQCYQEILGMWHLDVPKKSTLTAYLYDDMPIYCTNKGYFHHPLYSRGVCLKDDDQNGYFDAFSYDDTRNWVAFREHVICKYHTIFDEERYIGLKKELLYNGYANGTLLLQYNEF